MINTDKVFQEFCTLFDAMSNEEKKNYLQKMGFHAEPIPQKVQVRAMPHKPMVVCKPKTKADRVKRKRTTILKQVGE